MEQGIVRNQFLWRRPQGLDHWMKVIHIFFYQQDDIRVKKVHTFLRISEKNFSIFFPGLRGRTA